MYLETHYGIGEAYREEILNSALSNGIYQQHQFQESW